jgi:hypothetical protein
VRTTEPEAITADQTSGHAARGIQDLTAEYEATETIESRLVHDADKVETLLQAIKYKAQWYDTEAERDLDYCPAHQRGPRTGPGNRIDNPAMVGRLRRLIPRVARSLSCPVEDCEGTAL